MSLNIKNADAERLVRELSAATGEGVTQAVTVAVRERLERLALQAPHDVAERTARLDALSRDAAQRWTDKTPASEHGGLLYDEQGLPR
jgi:antitoxin VapB